LGTNRVVIPFRDEIGRIFTLFTRTTPASTPPNNEKYAPITPASDERSVLFNLWTIYGTDEVTLVEGCFDCGRALAAGFQNVIAANGANILPSHLEILRRRGISKILLVPDTDKVGNENAEKSVDMLAASGFECRIAELPAEFKDIDSLLGEFEAAG